MADITEQNNEILMEHYPEVYEFMHGGVERNARLPNFIPPSPANDAMLLIGISFAYWYDRKRDPTGLVARNGVPIPEQKDVALEDAIADSAGECKRLSAGKNLYLLWSGGIDSTLAYYALTEAGVPFTVLYDENSMNEYPLLYKELSESGRPMRKTDDNFCDLTADRNNFFVSGELGDQLMGSMDAMKLTHEERTQTLADAAAANTLKHIRAFPCSEPSAEFTANVIEFMFPAMQELFPRKTRENTTLGELLWFDNFNFKYTMVLFRLYFLGIYGIGPLRNTHHFYNTVKFQQYAMSHYEENCAYVRNADYKMPYKDYIYARNGDDDYRMNKVKVPSLCRCNYWQLFHPDERFRVSGARFNGGGRNAGV